MVACDSFGACAPAAYDISISQRYQEYRLNNLIYQAYKARMNQALLSQYLPIFVFLGVAGVLSAAAVVLSRLVGPSRPDAEKLSPYECGFEAFGDARGRFDVRFYLVAILFIIFDLEVAFLFPWAIGLSEIGEFGFWSMMIFLGILTIGFVYEWKKGALEWE